jgi:hypothetical protein
MRSVWCDICRTWDCGRHYHHVKVERRWSGYDVFWSCFFTAAVCLGPFAPLMP